MKKKTMTMLIALVLVLVCAVGGTLAWISMETNTVTNTFTVGDINIDIKETTGPEYKMVPGKELSKDPVVTVKNGSEACWLFVKVTKGNNPDTYLDYSVDGSWKPVPNHAGYYYKEVAATVEDTTFNVLTGNKVTVKSTVTKEMLSDAKTNVPKLSFQAAAVQRENVVDVEAAWGALPQTFTGGVAY